MRIVLTGGGTGGHVYPALAVAQALRAAEPSVSITYVGTGRGIERELAAKNGIEFRAISARGILGKSPVAALAGVMAAGRGVLEAMALLRGIRPSCVLGTGGYVSGPVVLAAATLGIPRAIQEQNAIAGFTNRLLGHVVQGVFLGFEDAAKEFPRHKVRVTGNPVRGEISSAGRDSSLKILELDPSKKTLFILGGSRGARSIVDAGLRLSRGGLGDDVQVLFVTGNDYYGAAARAAGAGITPGRAGNTILIPYIHNVENALACADLAVCRAGGMTVAELAAAGVPAVLVPSPNVANNHQEWNARALERKGGAVVVLEGERFVDRVEDTVRGLLADPTRLESMKRAARAAGRPGAAREIAVGLLSMARTGSL
ncbi:MAG: undecaprenyldiphospho-muramoylpentapeptide beta-N-acetylglucosaminyltransferase [Firmicutes bacterium]|nr:undecaprenyldiphospho-muramoylpentapeptide beta-N-acetylglucosaminyltransferase [Bacillota bacterium]